MTDVDVRLRTAMTDAAQALVPFVTMPAPQLISTPTIRKARRPQVLAGAGVFVTAAVVAVIVFLGGSGDREIGQQPQAGTIGLGVTVSRLPYLPPTLVRWTGGISFSTSTNGWALGTRCATVKANHCPPVLAHTTDAGRAWSLVADPTGLLATANNVIAGPRGLWVITGSNTLWYSGNGAESWTKVMTAYIAAYRVVNGRLVAYVHGAQDKKVSICTVTVSRVVFDGVTRVSSQRLSDDVLGGDTSSQIAADGSVWRSRPNTHACVKGMVVNGPPKIEVAPPGKDFGGLQAPPSASIGAWGLAVMNATTAYALLGQHVVVTTDGGHSWHPSGSYAAPSFALPPMALLGDRLLLESGGFFIGHDSSLTVQVRDSTGGVGSPLKVGSAPPPPTVKSFSYDAATLDGWVNPTQDEIGLLFRGRFVLSTDAGRTWHLQGSLPS